MSDHVVRNRAAWDGFASQYEAAGARMWDSEPSWGVFSVPDERVGVLPDVRGRRCVELGCGTGYVSSWLLRRGAALVVGIDNSAAQLRTARRLQADHDLPFPLVHADGERVPFADGTFDVAISEYGAAIWCDPFRWIPEAARLLAPGGTLVFLGNSQQVMLCVPDADDERATEQMVRPLRGFHRFEWPGDPGVEFHLSHGDWVRLLRRTGFEVLDLIEVYAEPRDTTAYPFVDATWAARWPVEEAWVARRLGP